MDAYDDIMKIAFQAEEAIDASVVEKFGKRFRDKQLIIREGDILIIHTGYHHLAGIRPTQTRSATWSNTPDRPRVR
jgi:hypothetical protein